MKNYCFTWAILSKNLMGWNPQRVNKRYRKYFSMLKFPTEVKEIVNFEKTYMGLNNSKRIKKKVMK